MGSKSSPASWAYPSISARSKQQRDLAPPQARCRVRSFALNPWRSRLRREPHVALRLRREAGLRWRLGFAACRPSETSSARRLEFGAAYRTARLECHFERSVAVKPVAVCRDVMQCQEFAANFVFDLRVRGRCDKTDTGRLTRFIDIDRDPNAGSSARERADLGEGRRFGERRGIILCEEAAEARGDDRGRVRGRRGRCRRRRCNRRRRACRVSRRCARALGLWRRWVAPSEPMRPAPGSDAPR